MSGPSRPGRPGRSARPARADVVIVGAIAASVVYGLALLPLTPSLIGSHPLLLEWLTASTVAEVAVGALSRVGDVPLVVALVAALPSSMAVDWAYWWAGRRWGDRTIHLLLGRSPGAATSPRLQARIARVERSATRWGPASVVLAYYLPVPNVLLYAAAGLGGMRLRTFLLLDTLGTLLWIGLAVGLGYAIGQRAVDVAHQVGHYGLYLSLAVVVVLLVAQVRSRRTPSAVAVEPADPAGP